MNTWSRSATVWLNDSDRRNLVVGPHGFAWWAGAKVFIGVFDDRPVDQPVSAYNYFDGEILEYPRRGTPKSAVVRFVKTGLLPG
jgi:hypothetical protein